MIHDDIAQKVVNISLTKIAQDRSVFSPKSSLHKHLLVNQVLAKAKCALTFSSFQYDEATPRDVPQVTKSHLQPLNNLVFDHEDSVEIERNGYPDDSNLNISGLTYDAKYRVEDKENAHREFFDRLSESCDDFSDDNDNEISENAQVSRNTLKRKVKCDSMTSLDCKRPKMSVLRPTYNIYEDFMDVDPQSARIGALITVFNSGFQGLLGDEASSHNELDCSPLCHSLCSHEYRTETSEYSLSATPVAMTV